MNSLETKKIKLKAPEPDNYKNNVSSKHPNQSTPNESVRHKTSKGSDGIPKTEHTNSKKFNIPAVKRSLSDSMLTSKAVSQNISGKYVDAACRKSVDKSQNGKLNCRSKERKTDGDVRQCSKSKTTEEKKHKINFDKNVNVVTESGESRDKREYVVKLKSSSTEDSEENKVEKDDGGNKFKKEKKEKSMKRIKKYLSRKKNSRRDHKKETESVSDPDEESENKSSENKLVPRGSYHAYLRMLFNKVSSTPLNKPLFDPITFSKSAKKFKEGREKRKNRHKHVTDRWKERSMLPDLISDSTDSSKDEEKARYPMYPPYPMYTGMEMYNPMYYPQYYYPIMPYCGHTNPNIYLDYNFPDSAYANDYAYTNH